jgi:hypothetical protein
MNGCSIVCWPPENTIDAKRHIYGEGENVTALYTTVNTDNNTNNTRQQQQHHIYQDSSYDVYNDGVADTAYDYAAAAVPEATADQYMDNNNTAAINNSGTGYEYNSHDYKISTNNVMSGLPVLQPSSDTYDPAYDDYNINPGMYVCVSILIHITIVGATLCC